MIKGIYTSAIGMLPKAVRMDVIANNLANINTTGFKKDNVFVQTLIDAARSAQMQNSELAGLNAQELTDYSQGSLNKTGNPFDLAIAGQGFFVVETPGGVRYTRNGNFTLSEDGTVTTSQGYPVLGDGGRIRLPEYEKLQSGDVVVTMKGEVIVNKVVVSKFQVVDFPQPYHLQKAEGALFANTSGMNPFEVDEKETFLRQGFLEESNVDAIEEMVNLIELGRDYESGQKAINYQDTSLERANEVGRV
jgi:flagellar basal-body rod protein FlgG